MPAITKPTVNGSAGTWGSILNDALDAINTATDTNTSGLATTNTNVTNVTNRVTTAENNITALQSAGGFYSGTAAQRASDNRYASGSHYYETDTQRHLVGATAGWVPIPGSMMFKGRCTSGTVSFADSATVLIPWDTEDYDRYNNFTPGAAATTWTVPVAGWYELTGAISITGNANGVRTIRWSINGSTAINGSGAQYGAVNAIAGFPARTLSYQLAAGDTIGLAMTQTSGSTLTVSVTSYLQPTMQAKYLGPD